MFHCVDDNQLCGNCFDWNCVIMKEIGLRGHISLVSLLHSPLHCINSHLVANTEWLLLANECILKFNFEFPALIQVSLGFSAISCICLHIQLFWKEIWKYQIALSAKKNLAFLNFWSLSTLHEHQNFWQMWQNVSDIGSDIGSMLNIVWSLLKKWGNVCPNRYWRKILSNNVIQITLQLFNNLYRMEMIITDSFGLYKSKQKGNMLSTSCG